MKKENMYKLFYSVSIFLIVVFIIRLVFDYYLYDSYSNSAPFYVCIIERSIEFLLPCIILLVIGILIKKKYVK